MAQNTSPVFPLVPEITWVNTGAVSANTTTDLTAGTNYNSGFTADATNGSRVDFIRVRALGTNVATVMRVWLNNGSATGTAANNTLFFERTLAATTVSQVAELPDVILPINVSLPAGYKIYYTFGTAVAAGYSINVVGGDY
jgi:hypothetical protein